MLTRDFFPLKYKGDLSAKQHSNNSQVDTMKKVISIQFELVIFPHFRTIEYILNVLQRTVKSQ